MFLSPAHLRVFVYDQPIDMRSGFERLSYYVREPLKENLVSGQVFLFLGHNRKRLKVLYHDGTGLILMTKRLEEGIFMDVRELHEVHSITPAELGLILSGHRIRYSLATWGKQRNQVSVESAS